MVNQKLYSSVSVSSDNMTGSQHGYEVCEAKKRISAIIHFYHLLLCLPDCQVAFMKNNNTVHKLCNCATLHAAGLSFWIYLR